MAMVRVAPVDVEVRTDWFSGTPREITWGADRLPDHPCRRGPRRALGLPGDHGPAHPVRGGHRRRTASRSRTATAPAAGRSRVSTRPARPPEGHHIRGRGSSPSAPGSAAGRARQRSPRGPLDHGSEATSRTTNCIRHRVSASSREMRSRPRSSTMRQFCACGASMATVNVMVDGSGTALMRSRTEPVRGREEVSWCARRHEPEVVGLKEPVGSRRAVDVVAGVWARRSRLRRRYRLRAKTSAP